jgi:glutathione peroxidase
MSFLFMFFSWVLPASIYSLQFNDVDNKAQSMSQYQGKKILLVNIATGSTKATQLAGLQQLQQQYGDKVAIIVFPSNSFGHESRSNAEIRQFCQSTYGVTFRIAEKNNVAGVGIQPVYNWLANSSENGVANAVVGGDFQKFLIGKDGGLIGMYASSLPPMDNAIVSAITGD